MKFGNLVCHTKNVSLLATPENANVLMDGNDEIIIGGLESIMDFDLRRNDDYETNELRLGEANG